MYNYKKYLKYKNKYINFQKLVNQRGGVDEFTSIVNIHDNEVQYQGVPVLKILTNDSFWANLLLYKNHIILYKIYIFYKELFIRIFSHTI